MNFLSQHRAHPHPPRTSGQSYRQQQPTSRQHHAAWQLSTCLAVSSIAQQPLCISVGGQVARSTCTSFPLRWIFLSIAHASFYTEHLVLCAYFPIISDAKPFHISLVSHDVAVVAGFQMRYAVKMSLLHVLCWPSAASVLITDPLEPPVLELGGSAVPAGYLLKCPPRWRLVSRD